MAGQSLRIGSRAIDVEQSPLPTAFVGSHHRFALTWPADGTLEIRYHFLVRLLAGVFCLMGLPFVALGLLPYIDMLVQPGAANPAGALCFLAWGGPIALVGLWLFGPRYRFDTAAGRLTIRRLGWTRRRPLAQILAVQVLDAGWFGSDRRTSPGGATPVKFWSYQLNLVLDDPNRPRLFVAYNRDCTDMVRKANVLANFLNVPLLAEPKFHELVRPYRQHDAAVPVPGVRRFRGNAPLRAVRDRRLPEPYRSWADRTQPLPPQVRLLPRSVDIVYDLGTFVIVGGMFLGMIALFLFTAWGTPVRNDPLFAAMVLLLALVPWFLLRRLWITLGAWRDQKRGTLRQGILVGPEGLLVRMEPNYCYAIAIDHFVNATTEEHQATTDFVIETLDGSATFVDHRLSAAPWELHRCVEEVRKSLSPRPRRTRS